MSTLFFCKQFLRSIWLFPVILSLLLVTLTALRLSGSSIGVYPQIDGTAAQDTDSIAFNPRGVRSDEWLVNTQMVVAQANNDFKRVNDNIGNGQDMSLVVDVPYKEWSAAFKPQNLAFFVLPLEHAFALKWWFLGFLLILACYFLLLELFPKKILLATLVSTFVGLTPMFLWWYQSVTVLPIAYSFITIILVLRLIKATTRTWRLIYSLLLAYVLTCFALLLYPPFQIPCAIATIVFLVGWILDTHRERASRLRILRLWPYIALTIVVVGSAAAAFYYTRKGVIQAITHTVYPGTRVVMSGGMDPLFVFSSFLSPNLQYDEKAASGYLKNQSEASNFILLAPYLFLPCLYVTVREKRKHNRMLWGLLLINILIAGFLARMFLHTAWLEPLYRLLLLDKVPHSRLLLGLGLVGIFQLIFIIKYWHNTQLSKREIWMLSLFASISGLAVMMFVGLYTIHHYPVFIASLAKVTVFALFVAGGLFLLLRKQVVAAMILLVIFSFMSVYKVHPIYRGLEPLTTSKPIQSIKAFPDDGNWVVLDDRLIINFPAMAGKHSLNAVNFYPQLSLWKQIDKQGVYDNVYNRFAHVMFTSEKTTDPFVLKYTDMFVVAFNPCDDFLQRNAKYALSPAPLTQKCIRLESTVRLPAKTLYIYKVLPR